MPTRCACLMNFSAHLLMHCTLRHSYKFCEGHQVTSGACAQSQSAVASHMSFRRRAVARTCPMALICMCAAALTCMLAQNARAFCAASRHAWGTSTDRHIVAVVWKPHPLLICVELSSPELTHAVAEAALCQAIVRLRLHSKQRCHGCVSAACTSTPVPPAASAAGQWWLRLVSASSRPEVRHS
jgi:hypothetical protein